MSSITQIGVKLSLRWSLNYDMDFSWLSNNCMVFAANVYGHVIVQYISAECKNSENLLSMTSCTLLRIIHVVLDCSDGSLYYFYKFTLLVCLNEWIQCIGRNNSVFGLHFSLAKNMCSCSTCVGLPNACPESLMVYQNCITIGHSNLHPNISFFFFYWPPPFKE